jgi:MIR domain
MKLDRCRLTRDPCGNWNIFAPSTCKLTFFAAIFFFLCKFCTRVVLVLKKSNSIFKFLATTHDEQEQAVNMNWFDLRRWAEGFMGWGQPCRLRHVTSGRYLAATADGQVVTYHRSAATEDATAFIVRQSKVGQRITLTPFWFTNTTCIHSVTVASCKRSVYVPE